jgi:hypothetical protein
VGRGCSGNASVSDRPPFDSVRLPLNAISFDRGAGPLLRRVFERRARETEGFNQAQQAEPLASGPDVHPPPPPACASPSLAALRRGWARLLRRVYETDPLVCPRCQGVMRVVAFITEGRILDHLGASAFRAPQDRAPPLAPAAVPSAAGKTALIVSLFRTVPVARHFHVALEQHCKSFTLRVDAAATDIESVNSPVQGFVGMHERAWN